MFVVEGSEIGGESQGKMEFSQDVVDALDLLLQYTPLLDIMDSKYSCNCLECLLKELLRNGLVTEAHVTHFTSKRCVITLTLMYKDSRYFKFSGMLFVGFFCSHRLQEHAWRDILKKMT